MKENKIFNLAVLSITTIGVGMMYNYAVDNGEEVVVEAVKSVSVEVTTPKIDDISKIKKHYGIIRGIQEESLSPISPSKALEVKVKKGDFVKKNQILAIYDSSSAEEQIEIYKNNYERVLSNTKRIEQNYSEMKSKLKDIELSLKSSHDLLSKYTESYNGPTPVKEINDLNNKISELNNEKVELETEISNINLQEYKDKLEKAKKSYEVVMESKEGFILRAPYDGVVSNLNAVEGEVSNPFLPPVEVADNSSMIFDVRVPASDIDNIKEGESYTIKLKDSNGNLVTKEGKVIDVSDKEDSITRLYSVKLSLTDNVAEINSSAVIEIPMKTEKNALVVPKDSISRKNKKAYIHIVKNNKVEKREVSIGVENDNFVEIKNGIDKNDIIIIKSEQPLEDGDTVNIINENNTSEGNKKK